jgi:hypothetical protein
MNFQGLKTHSFSVLKLKFGYQVLFQMERGGGGVVQELDKQIAYMVNIEQITGYIEQFHNSLLKRKDLVSDAPRTDDLGFHSEERVWSSTLITVSSVPPM